MVQLRRRAAAGITPASAPATKRVEAAWQRLSQGRSIAHDARAPLSAIIAQAQLALQPATGEVTFLALTKILDEARRLDSMLDMLAVTGDQPGPRFVELDLAEVIEDEVSRLPRRQFDRIEMHLAPAAITADEMSIRRLVVNLVSNALLHTDAPITIMVTTARDVVFTVADRGEGLRASTQPEAGHGLGLGIVESVVELHGGGIDVHPRFGGGTTVTVSLPKREAAPVRPASPSTTFRRVI